MSDRLVTAHTQGRVRHITLDSRLNRNALSLGLLQQLLAELSAAGADTGIRVVVLGHTGDVFCSGADLKEQLQRFQQTGMSPGAGGLVPILKELQNLPKPVVAQVAGAVRGGGMGLVAASDLVVAAESATFAFSESRVGVAPAVIAVPVLARIPRSAALEMFLTGRTFTAAEALAMGLVTRVVPPTSIEEATAVLVTELLKGAPIAQGEIKRLISTVPKLDPELAFDRMVELSQELFSSPEGQEGMAAFRERRPPAWSVP